MATYSNDKSSSSSDEDDSEIEESELDAAQSRSKRAISWCGVTTTNLPAGPSKSEDVSNGTWKLRPTGGPIFGNRMQLFSKTNYNLAVNFERVYGTQEDYDIYSFLKIENAGREGTVRIYGMYSQMYIAMDEKGRLVPVANQTNATLFEEARHYNYNTYLSLMNAHKGWYLGIKKNGKFKNGQKTGHKQKACLFIPRRGKFE